LGTDPGTEKAGKRQTECIFVCGNERETDTVELRERELRETLVYKYVYTYTEIYTHIHTYIVCVCVCVASCSCQSLLCVLVNVFA